MTEGKDLELFSGGTALEEQAGAATMAAREESEVKAAVVLARNFPRDEQAAFVAMQRSARRPTFAHGALYSFPRGGRAITGPSVKMAREMARCWGNLQHGIRLLSMDADYVQVEGWAWDLQTNTRVASEAKFKRLIQRGGGWVEPDERDLRELVNKHGAVCVRNSILQLMAPDVVDELERMCLATNRKAAEGDIEEDRDQVLRSLAAAFSNMGVTTKMLEQYLGHALEVITPAELADLRAVFTSLRDGTVERTAYFNMPGAAAAPGHQSMAASNLEDKLRDAHGDAPRAQSPSEPLRSAVTVLDSLPSPVPTELPQDAENAREEPQLDFTGTPTVRKAPPAVHESSPGPTSAPEAAPGALPSPVPAEPDDDAQAEGEDPQQDTARSDLLRKAKAARERVAKQKGELEAGEPDVRVVDKNWVGALPNTRELPAVLDKIADPEVVLNMLRLDDRKTAPSLYHARLCGFEDLGAVLQLVGDDEDLVIAMLGLDTRPWTEPLYDGALGLGAGE